MFDKLAFASNPLGEGCAHAEVMAHRHAIKNDPRIMRRICKK
jgi:hypothetical protein